MFSESDSSGEAALLFKLGAELGVMARSCQLGARGRCRSFTILPILYALKISYLRVVKDTKWLSGWSDNSSHLDPRLQDKTVSD